MARIRHIYLSPGHNFFGHHGQEPGTHPMLEVPAVACLPGRGLVGDRFCDFKDDYQGQVTFFSWEVFQGLCANLHCWDKPPSVLRRNIITEGLDLLSLIDAEFELQGIRFAGTQECSPCHWMNDAFEAGAEEFLAGQGGLRARILTAGTIRTGEAGAQLPSLARTSL